MYVSSYHKNKHRENQQGSTEVSYLQEVGCGRKWKGCRKEGHFSEDTKLDAGTYSQKNQNSYLDLYMACRDQYKIFLHTYAIIWDNFYLYFPCLLLYSYLCNEPVLIFFFPWFVFTTLLHLTYVLYHTRHETDTDARGEEKAKSRAQRKAKITKKFWAATQQSFT